MTDDVPQDYLSDADRVALDEYRHMSFHSQQAEKAGLPHWKAQMYWLENRLKAEEGKVAAFTDGKIYLVCSGDTVEIVLLTRAQAEWWVECLTEQSKRHGPGLSYKIVTRSVGFCRSVDLALTRS